jgi:signal transduction histidine kinase
VAPPGGREGGTIARIRSAEGGPEAPSRRAPSADAGGQPLFAGFDEADSIFSGRYRAAAVALALATVLAAIVIGPQIDTSLGYIRAFVGISVVPVVAAQVASAVAVRRGHPDDRRFWTLWLAGNLALGITGIATVATATDPTSALRFTLPVGVFVVGLLFLKAHADAMRRRSGDLSLSLDLVQGLITTVLIGCLVFTALGTRLFDSAGSWFTLPTAMTFSGTVIGLVWSAQLFLRAPRETRRIDGITVIVGVVSVGNSLSQLAMAVSNFTLPAAPLLVAQALNMSVLLLVPLHASRRCSPGLDRQAPHEQVRSTRALTIFMIATIPVIGLEVAIVRDEVSWAVANFAVTMAFVAVLVAVRNLLALRETTRLYEAVASASAERQRLLVALLRNIDDERHRFAAQLHQQATASYATFAAFVHAAALTSPGVSGSLAETSAEVRAELSRNADSLRDLMRAVKPIEHEPGSARGMTTSIQAFVNSLYGNSTPPRLNLSLAEELQLDWATEAVVLRVLQEAIANVWRHAQATRIDVRVGPAAGGREGVEVEVVDDGRGFDPATIGREGGLATVRAFVDLTRGRLEVHSRRGQGTTVWAVFGPLGTPPPSEPTHLQAVIDLTD